MGQAGKLGQHIQIAGEQPTEAARGALRRARGDNAASSGAQGNNSTFS